ncbi:unnamed protein product [Ambrosiozyma monospora]|uniref:Unnamed protein product n=1 Tax=Ambrosiozyma monospora TaxID=43982 RepID=A0ACB5TYK1_AMBMO|nr:unnamed protein product [Ambrosiozyma monospora]
MGKQQKAFMAKNKKYFSEEESATKTEDKNDKSKGQKDDEPRSCILCRNTENHDELFGLPALICESSGFWNLPVIEAHPPELMVKEFHQHNTEQDKDNESVINKQKIACFGTKNVKAKHVISGCSHGMHYSCFTNMLREKKWSVSEFSCPLCNTFCNAFIPSVLVPGTFNMSMDGFLRANSWQEALRNQNTENCIDMSSLIFGKEFFHVLNDTSSPQNKKIFNQLSHLSHENLMLNKISSTMDIDIGTGNAISILIGNTLELLQIASRLEGETEDAKISEINLELLRSLVQFKGS